MVDMDLIFAKINSIQNCLLRIDNTLKSHKSPWSYDAQDIIVLNIQRAVQATIDIAAHIVASENLGIAGTLKELFQSLEKNGSINHELAEKMKKMVGFRNIVVHDYQDINVNILQAVVNHHLKDFEAFYTAILKHYKGI